MNSPQSTRLILCALIAMMGGLSTMAGAASATESTGAQPGQPSGQQLLESAADITTKRLPTCESTIRTRVSEWTALAVISCKKLAGVHEAACVNVQLKARAEQLKRLRSCRFL